MQTYHGYSCLDEDVSSSSENMSELIAAWKLVKSGYKKCDVVLQGQRP